MKIHPFAVGVILLASCAREPDTAHIAEFGSAVDASSKALNDIADENRKVALLAEREDQAGAFIRNTNFNFVPKPTTVISEHNIDLRRQELLALADYGAALKNATDTAKLDKLQAAAGKLVTSTASLVALAVPVAAPIAAPLASIAGKGIGTGIRNGYVEKINAVVSRTDPALQAAVIYLKRDFQIINRNTATALVHYEDASKLNLVLMLQKKEPAPAAPVTEGESTNASKVSASGPSDENKAKPRIMIRDPDHLASLYEAFLKKNDDVSEANTAVEASAASVSVLDKIAKAHHALAEQSATAKVKVEDLLSISSDLTALLKALEKGA
ncbi:hypothetical protein [Rhizobium tubonense]|uniref:Uncharacterized protein n=1 Tax=Rhizobium tubonense TaxID=484088 RepID=A0A2W4CR80_9HYPH|nr:hypothetical protein [Rhizobium tubonense]PZM07954.1 hypothetical protein CPY51_29785 [Rhizobium tubonense]